MNLHKSMTADDGWFPGVIAVTAIVEVLFLAACVVYLWRRRVLML